MPDIKITQLQLIAGVDEVGRGPLAGPVIASAVILDPKRPIEGIADSKKLTEKKREALFDLIREQCIAYAIGRADVDEIDHLNILQASLLAMQRAVNGLFIKPTKALIDGNRCPELFCPSEAIIKGDNKVLSISAASILAKVMRDREMLIYDKKYPGYGFAQHKGYGTKKHLAALHKLGVTEIHRKNFAPVMNLSHFEPHRGTKPPKGFDGSD